MKHAYPCWQLAVATLLFLNVVARAQPPWRPFRPGLIYSFTTPSNPNRPTGSYLLRLDSAYTTAAGDSGWAFNRVLRPLDGSAMTGHSFGPTRQSRNNLFGARMSWRPGSSEFILENVAEGSHQAALTLRLRPRAAVGSTWTASTAPALTATLTSRTWQPVTSAAGSPFDSVANITLSSGAVLRLSRQHGLLAGPRWLGMAGAGAPQWESNQLPVPLAASPLYPATLFSMQPGDLLGYLNSPLGLGGPACEARYTLRVIQTREVVGDSLVYTYREQVRTQTNYAGCGGPIGSTIAPAGTRRLTFSLRTGQSPQYVALPLLSGEYKVLNPAPQLRVLVVGLGLNPTPGGGSCLSGNAYLTYQHRYPSGTAAEPLYTTASDGNWQQRFGYEVGLGDNQTADTQLTYYRRTTTGGGVITCGQAGDFSTLLPTRAARAAALATLHPNPAAESVALALTQPAPPGCALRLTEALGRSVWRATVAAGQTAVVIPLAGQPAGLYLLHLSNPEAVVIYKLTHE